MAEQGKMQYLPPLLLAGCFYVAANAIHFQYILLLITATGALLGSYSLLPVLFTSDICSRSIDPIASRITSTGALLTISFQTFSNQGDIPLPLPHLTNYSQWSWFGRVTGVKVSKNTLHAPLSFENLQ